MSISVRQIRTLLLPIGFGALVISLAILFAACGAPTQPPPAAPVAAPVVSAAPAVPVQVAAAAVAPRASAPEPAKASVALKVLKVQQDGGYGGASFSISAEGLPPNKAAELLWATWDGVFDTNVMPETIEFVAQRFADKRVPLGKATTDAQGRLAVDFKAPEDYGGVHDIYLVVDGQDVARGGFQIRRSVSISPKEGPVGTPITISITGMGKPPVEHLFLSLIHI